MVRYAPYSDQEIVQSILNRDKEITFNYLYKDCYPLFKAIFNKYYTDCNECIEFINEIYVLIITPKKENNRSPLSDFGLRCTLTMWLKLVAENYCRHLYKKRRETSGEENFGIDDRLLSGSDSLDIDLTSINAMDVETVLSQMHHRRYSQLIRLRYLEGKTNEETAEILEMTMANYYNKHKLAKKQLINVLRKEGLL